MEKRKYKYFGSGEIESPYGHIKKFGQEIPLFDNEALDMIQHGGLLLSEDFDAIGWTPLERSNKNERVPANKHFMECHQKALAKRLELIDELTAKLAAFQELPQ